MTETATDHAPHHRDAEQLAAGLDHVRRSPTDAGTVQMLVVRPAVLERQVLDRAEISATAGVVGDTWDQRPSRRTADGGPNPDAQVTVMNARAAHLVAGGQERWPLAGDQIYVDLDLSLDNLPTGTRLSLGSAVLEVTDAPHTGCAKFSERFGVEALRLTATPDGKQLRLRGINTRVVQAGTVAIGDAITVERPGA
jgi:MOSC domain-containing protein YiiM